MDHKMSGHKFSVLIIFIFLLSFPYRNIHSSRDSYQLCPASIYVSPEMRQNPLFTLESEAPKFCFSDLSCYEVAHETLKQKLSLHTKGYQ